MACAAALAVLDVMESNRLVDNARETGGYLMAQLRGLMAEEKRITDVRGRGLMIGIDLDMPPSTASRAAHPLTYCACCRR